MRTFLSRILGNSDPWIREHRDAEIAEVQAVGEKGERIYRFQDKGDSHAVHVDRNGNVLDAEATT
jgi:hypothetical protein